MTSRSRFWAAALTMPLLTATAVVCAQEEPAAGDQAATAENAVVAAQRGSRVGLVDMSYVFKHYRKFDVGRLAIRSDVAAAEAKAKRLATELQLLQGRLTKLPDGSDEHAALDQQLVKQKAEFEAFRKSVQRDVLVQESQLYKTIYLEVGDAIREHARAKGFDLVLRFTRDEVGDASEPKEILQDLQRTVLYHNPDDDLTDAVLETLNANYDAESN